MTTWNSRIILRNDSDWVFDNTQGIDYELKRGEVGAEITANRLVVRVGVDPAGSQFRSCPLIYEGPTSGINLPLSVEVPEGSGLDDGTILRWDPTTSRFVPDAEPIGFASPISGALTYTASDDRWSADETRFIPDLVDGGTFIADGPETVAPLFTSVPSIGEPTTP